MYKHELQYRGIRKRKSGFKKSRMKLPTDD
jgi:hypothetical protein